jgi:hypothetical protein
MGDWRSSAASVLFYSGEAEQLSVIEQVTWPTWVQISGMVQDTNSFGRTLGIVRLGLAFNARCPRVALVAHLQPATVVEES